MYKICNFEWNQSDPRIFSTFENALDAWYEKDDVHMQIYSMDEENHELVWDASWLKMNPELESTLTQIKEFNSSF